ncbi:flavin containing amine oxidoreductase-like protein [Oceanimonas sp. GK1]|uniref:NAD(P)/FAD-dependent oxidoreductase n=1 Tax=Oceanimonas sp. (strain GK1 / IBRC-M 10197) TaxID=511062 RepID=UPI0002494C85|nr:FAD-dependent oxidoreductase [Oceanimonas sp. GK1]AEX99853.1 flavin containing amine oxidoreductase-like protein [Oceanimonas sp. GK1]
MTPRIAIIGAGLAGLTLARELSEHADITLFEKARGLGGRMSSRRRDQQRWDHGAQFFTARSRAFKALLTPFMESGAVVAWQPNITTLSPNQAPYKRPWFEPHYVAAPAMNSLLKAMSPGLNIALQTRVQSLEPQGDRWRLLDDQGEWLGEFDWVISSAPLPQTRELLPLAADAYAGFGMRPCYALMLTVDDRDLPVWDAAKVNDSPLGWIAFNHRLPGRNPEVGAVVAHSSADWAEAHLEDDQDAVREQLTAEFCALTGVAPNAVQEAQLHRWRYALATEVDGEPVGYVLDTARKLAACGDWCLGGRVEAAFTSARRLAARLRERGL